MRPCPSTQAIMTSMFLFGFLLSSLSAHCSCFIQALFPFASVIFAHVHIFLFVQTSFFANFLFLKGIFRILGSLLPGGYGVNGKKGVNISRFIGHDRLSQSWDSFHFLRNNCHQDPVLYHPMLVM